MIYGLLKMFSKKREKPPAKYYLVYWYFHALHEPVRSSSILAANPIEAEKRLRALIARFDSTPIGIAIITEEGASHE